MRGEVLARSLLGNANFRFMVKLPLIGIETVAAAGGGRRRTTRKGFWKDSRRPRRRRGCHPMSAEERRCGRGDGGRFSNSNLPARSG